MADFKSEAIFFMKIQFTAIVLIILTCLSGCIPTNIIDDILMVEAEGTDYLGGGKVMGTVTMPSYIEPGNPGGAGAGLPTTASMMRSISGVTYDGKSLVSHFQPEGQRMLKISKVRIFLYDTALARNGLSKQFDFLNRDPDAPHDLTVAIVEGSTKDLLTYDNYQTQIPISRYAQDLILQNMQQNYPDINMNRVLYSYYGAFMDPVIPLIRRNGDHLELRGLALFNHDKYVMKIRGNDVFIFKMLYENFNQGVYDFEYEPDKHVAIRNVHTTVRYRVRNGNSRSPDIYAHVKMIGQVRQAYPGSISKHSADVTERKLERHMQQKAEDLFTRLQKKGVDPLRIGDTVRSFTYHFDGKSWHERYAHATFHCKVSVNITQTGISR
jgi:spore germination protein